MQLLSLSEKEKIELLANGVRDSKLRKMVLSTWITNIPNFLEYVKRITEDTVGHKYNNNSRFGIQGRQVGREQLPSSDNKV